MNKRELIEHISSALDKYLKNTTFVKPVLTITEIAESNEVSLEFEVNKNCILLDDNRQELNKPVVPHFVADWYEEHKDDLDYNIWNYVYEWENQEDFEFKNWFNHSKKAFQTLVNMHQFGYTVEKEKRYLVKMKGMQKDCVALKKNKDNGYWYLSDTYPYGSTVNFHTRKELEDAGFGWVFDCEGVEVEEVEE